MTPIQELIKQLKEEKHRYMMQEHHPLELYIIEDCFDSAIWKAKELLEKEKKQMCDFADDYQRNSFQKPAEEYYKETYNK